MALALHAIIINLELSIVQVEDVYSSMDILITDQEHLLPAIVTARHVSEQLPTALFVMIIIISTQLHVLYVLPIV
jgi:hypothetical protein